MSVLRLEFQDGHVEEHGLADGQLLVRLEPSGGIGVNCFQGGVYSASELKAVTLPVFVPQAPPQTEPPRLKTVTYDLTPRDTDGRAWGKEIKFRSLAWDDAEPEPPKPTKRKPKAAPRPTLPHWATSLPTALWAASNIRQTIW